MSHHDHIVKQFCEPIGEDSESYRIKKKILDLQQIQDRKKDEYERERAQPANQIERLKEKLRGL